MKITIMNKLLLILILSTFGVFVQAHNSSVQTLAGIVSSIAHLPSDEQKVILLEMSSSKESSAAVKVMAKVMHGFQHNVTAEDKLKLDAIVADAKASAAEKELASIIMGLAHNADAATKARLAKIH